MAPDSKPVLPAHAADAGVGAWAGFLWLAHLTFACDPVPRDAHPDWLYHCRCGRVIQMGNPEGAPNEYQD